MITETILRQRYNVQSVADVGLGAARKPPELFKDFLLQKSIIMISAEPFVGKSMFSLAMLIALDANQPLLKHYSPHQPLRTLFIGQDSPLWDYAEQARKLMVGYKLTPTQIQTLSSDLIINEGLSLNDSAMENFLTHWHDQIGFDVLMLDTLAACHAMDENSNTEMNVVMNRLKRFREIFGCTIIFTHHDSKPSKDAERSAVYRPRGASVISGSVDIHVSLKPNRDGSIRLTVPKGRGLGPRKKPVVYDMLDCGTPTEPGVELVIRRASESEASVVLDLVLSLQESGDDGAADRKDIVKALMERFPPDTVPYYVDTNLAKLEQQGLIRKAGRGKWQRIPK